jgi:branched-chain amino acid transport system permease protein
VRDWKGFLGALGMIVVLVWPLVPHVPSDLLGTAILASSYGIVALSLVLLIGMVGQISLAQASLVGIGAFAAALATKKLGWGFPFTLAVGAGAGAGLAALIGAVGLRVRGLYLAVATLIFAFVCDQYLFAQPWMVESPSGTSIAAQVIGTKGQLPYFDLADRHIFYYVALAVAAGVVYGLANLRESRIGRAFAAIRGSEVAAASLGINVVRYKLMGFMLAGGIAGLGGALSLAGSRTVAPAQFNFQSSLFFLSIAVVGGLRSIGGAVFSALLFAVLVGEVFFRYPAVGKYLTLVSGIVLAVVLLFFRGGLGAVPERASLLWDRYLADRRAGHSDLRPAAFWIRAFAYLIDSLLLGVALTVVGFLTRIYPAAWVAFAAGNRTGAMGGLAFLYLVGFVGAAAYFVVLWQHGATVGMRMLGLRVIDEKGGGPIGYPRAVLRYLGLQISSLPLYLGLIWAGWDGRKQGWHDKFARTAVVYRHGSEAVGERSGEPRFGWLSQRVEKMNLALKGLLPGWRVADDRLRPLDITSLVSRISTQGEAQVIPLQRVGEPKDSVAVRSLLRSAAGTDSTAGTPTSLGRREPVYMEADHITVRFGGLTAVDEATIQVGAGEIVGLIGPNGAGKTTLFNSILGLNEPTEGKVMLFGENVTKWPVHRRAALGVGRTFQFLQLFADLTVFENLLVATHREFGPCCA